MKTTLRILTLSILWISAAAGAAQAQEGADLATRAHGILKKHCHRCHGVNFEVAGFDVLNRDLLLAARADKQPSYIVAANLEESLIWQRVAVSGDMPPGEGAELSAAEKDTLKEWINAGAPFPALEKRPFLTELSVLTTINRHLATVPETDRKFQRYFTLTHLYNNHQAVSEEALRQTRAALSKLVNSLSWKDRITVPSPLDPEETILHVDLRSFGWDKISVWDDVLEAYPYGLKYENHPEPNVREAARQLFQLSNDELLWFRADWFIATASRPPLYHEFLELPETDAELQKMVNVNVKTDFNLNSLARAGFAGSGVSGQNRLVDRHHSLYGAYWQSYDFKTNLDKGSLVHFPLGPAFEGNKFAEQAFQHDGGEIVFNLPNGLQGYLLVDNKGNRINEGPTDIVSDTLKTSGSAAIVTGLSCMACHKNGVIRFKDTVRDGIALSGDVRDKVQKLYPKQEVMDALLAKDEARFLKAVELATGPFLQVGAEAKRNIRDFAEPIGTVALNYNKDLTAVEAALELNIENPERFQFMVQGNRRLAQFGLGQFKGGATIKREQWTSLKDDETLFQRTARELELGLAVSQ